MIYEEGYRIRMEEEEEECGEEIYERPPVGFQRIRTENLNQPQRVTSNISNEIAKTIGSLAKEREEILKNEKISSRQKIKLLESNRKAIIVLSGGKITKTDSVIYGILIFGGIVILTLALLNVFGGLSTEITMTFIGTTMGGVIATIAQKLGRLS